MTAHLSKPAAQTATLMAVFILDVLAVMVFATVGRRSHGGGLSIESIAQTAWPFLLALVLGWLLSAPWRTKTRLWRSGCLIWVSTLGLGMLSRWVFTDGGVQPSFILVAGVVLAALLGLNRGVVALGPRLIGRAARRRRTAQEPV